MMIVVHTNYPLLVISVFSALLHYCLAQPCVKSTDMRNTVVDKGDSSSFPDLYPDDNVQWQVAPSNQPFESEKDITDFGGPVQPPYIGIYTVDNAKLTILNATATPDGNTDPTAGLYIAKYPTEGCSAAAGLTVVEIPPTCGYDVSIPSTPKLTCSITFANYVQQQIVPIINWVDSSGTVVQTETPERQTLDQSNLGLQTSTSTFTVPNGDSSSYACVVTFSAPTEFQPDFIATNAPDYNASCLVSLPTTTAASTTTKILTSTATTTAAATTTTTTTPTTPLDTTSTKPLTSTSTTTAAATSTATTPNPTTTPLVTTTAKLLTSIAATTMAATSTIAKSNPTTVITQASAMSNAPSTGISQLSDNPTTATIATTNPATASVAATQASGTATAIIATAPMQSTNPSISNIAVTPANTPITTALLQTGTVVPPASTTTSSTLSPPMSPVSSSMSSSFSGSTPTSASQPSAVSNEPDTDDQAQTLKIVLGLVLGSLLATALVSACWCYCCFFPLGIGARGAKQTQRILLVRRIFFFWRREPPVQRIHYYPVYRRPQVVHEHHFRYPALRKTFHWREPSENGVFWRWDPTANDAYSRRGF